jgi:hypothetical protein
LNHETNRLLPRLFAARILVLLAALDQTIVSTTLLTILRELGGVTQLAWVVTDLFDRQHDRRPLYGKFGASTAAILQAAIVMGSALCGLA